MLHTYYLYNTIYNIFISYEKNDISLVKNIARKIESCGINVWVDYSRIEAGEHFPLEIADGINKSHYFVLIATSYIKRSQYVGVEIGIRIRRPRFCLFGFEIKSSFMKVDTRNIIIVDVEDNSENIPDILKNLHRIIIASSSFDDIDSISTEISNKIRKKIYG